MNIITKLNLSAPIIFVNPYFNQDCGLINAVTKLGGIGVLDLATADCSSFMSNVMAPFAVRVHPDDNFLSEMADQIKLAIIPFEGWNKMLSFPEGTFSNFPFPVLVEVGSAEQGIKAEKLGAQGLIVRGNEGSGWVSPIHGFVLLQRVLEITTLPVFLQGGVGPCTASGAIKAGASGIVLDHHLLLTKESAIHGDFKNFLANLSLSASTTLNEISGHPFRVYSRIGTRKVRELKKLEQSITEEQFPDYYTTILKSIGFPTALPDTDDSIFPFSDDLVINKDLLKENLTVSDVFEKFREAMNPCSCEWPFEAGSPLSIQHGVKFPIVQGPMAHVSDNIDFLQAVIDGGALPFLALGNMPGPIAAQILDEARAKSGDCFGVGLIGLEVNRSRYEAHLDTMKKRPPKFAILAAGSPELAKTIEDMGTSCYLHCPSPGLLEEALNAGLRRFVFEGGESGGHIASLSSLNLWNANLNQLEKAHKQGLDLSNVSVLFAGGIGSDRGAAFIAGMASSLILKGLKVGLQIGTAYLTTKEAVDSHAITESYAKLTLDSQGTVVIGQTVNTMARAACSPMANIIIERELERLRSGMPLRDRKENYEHDNLGALRLASKGCAIDPSTSQSDCPQFCELEPEDQLERGLYLMGQVVCMLNQPTTIAELHSKLVDQGREIYNQTSKTSRSAIKVLSDSGTDFDHNQSLESQVNAVDSPIFSDVSENSQNMKVTADNEPIAVIGIGLRFPGADSPEKFWDQIIEKRSGIVAATDDRWGSVDMYYDPDPKTPDKTYSRIGGFINDFKFDPLKYRIPPMVAQKMDRTQKMAVACVADALADAGLTPESLRGQKVGIVIGNSMGGETTDMYAERIGLPKAVERMKQSLISANIESPLVEKIIEDFRTRYLAGLPDITEDSLPGELSNVISGRIANVFNLEGPNFTVDAACASSMAAVMSAVSGLRSRSMDYAIVGGVDASMQPSSFVKFCKIGALSGDGSRPFDAAANGFVMGEGAGILVLKRLSDAQKDKDRIYALILGVGSSSDGRGKGITAPNAAGQERAIRACIESVGIDPASIGLIEAHGTSTAVGDKTELLVLDKFFRESRLSPGTVGIGSVKSQIGHLKAASGAAGIIKAILSLQRRTLPPTANIKNPNPCLDWETSPLFLINDKRKWAVSGDFPRRAGVSAFGFGGTNFHVILQEHNPVLKIAFSAKREPIPKVEFVKPVWPKPHGLRSDGAIWAIGGNEPEQLAGKINSILSSINPANFDELASHNTNECRSYNLRFGFAALDVETVSKKLVSILEAIQDPSKRNYLSAKGVFFSEGDYSRNLAGAAFLFPGQGSQYPYMLRDLCERFPIVARTFQQADEIMEELGQKEISALVFPDPDKIPESGANDALKDTQILQPMILTADTAIFRLLEQMGLKPTACAGHSLGEYAACVAAGVFSFRDALEAVAVRGREMARVSIADPGLMMSIPADARLVEEVLAQVDGYVVAANKNSPKQTVISGETEAVKKAAQLFKDRGMEPVLIPVSAAFHSGVVAPAREPFMKTLENLRVCSPSTAIISNVTGDYYPVGPGAPAKIRDLLGKQFAAPVEWVKTLRRLYGDGIRVFIECGPKRVMTNLTLDTLPKDSLALPTNHPKKGGIIQLFESLAALIVEGFELDIQAASALSKQSDVPPLRKRPSLAIVASDNRPDVTDEFKGGKAVPAALDALLDPDIEKIVSKPEFKRFMELQGSPIRSLIKSSFSNFMESILPLEKTVSLVKTEGMEFKPVVISGMATGLPTDIRFPFDKANLDDLLLGKNFIKKVPEKNRREMLEKNVERLFKGASGEVEIHVVDDMSGVIKLAGFFENHDSVLDEFGIDRRLIESMDVTTRLAVGAGIEALRDAGVPLIQEVKTTTTGGELPGSWILPPALREETGVIFASAFPGMASLVDEVTKEARSRFGAGSKKRLIEFYTGIVQRLKDDREKESITKWFTQEFEGLSGESSDDIYTFNRNFLLRVMSMGHSQLAQLIKAQGPNTHVDAACAGTTQAVLLAKDWIRTGRAKRVLVVAADDVAGRLLFPWIGSGFLAMGAATTNAKVDEAALPFDDRRHGLILGSAAVALVVESEGLVKQRGMDPIASIEAGIVANSGFHGTRLDVDHISTVMEKMISRWEKQSGLSRHELARKMFFMSHETYSPKRGGSSSAEIKALRSTFGESARTIPIANTKGYTGHTMGVGVEDVVALRCLQKQILPPIPNLRVPDPEFQDMNLSSGGSCEAEYALRLAAGFGSQIVMSLYKIISHEENRVVDFTANRAWLKEISGFNDPVISIEDRTLKVRERQIVETASTSKAQSNPLVGASTEKNISVPTAVKDSDTTRQIILALLSEKTGYPSEMLDTNLDLEADLGIDTVKQAEFITEVRENFGIPRIEGLKIADFPTIEHIINFVLEQTSGETSGMETVDSDSTPTGNQLHIEGVAEIGAKILELLSAKTGYPPEMLDPDLDLEADLGIDTVKQAEFITEVRETFGIPRIEGLKIADFPTVKHIIGFVMEKKSKDTSKPVPEHSEGSASGSTVSTDSVGASIYEAKLVPAKVEQRASVPEIDELLIIGGDDSFLTSIRKKFEPVPTTWLVDIAALDKRRNKRTGIVNLAFDISSDSELDNSFELFRKLAQTYDNGPVFLVNVVSEDGAWGFEAPKPTGYLSGAVTGAAKSFSREYPDTICKCLDIHPDILMEHCADLVFGSLVEDFPLETGINRGLEKRVIRFHSGPQISDKSSSLKQGEVILVSGGARGITAECLKAMAAQNSVTFAILARTTFSNHSESMANYSDSEWNTEKFKIIERYKREGKAATPVLIDSELSKLRNEVEVYNNFKQLRSMGCEVIYRSVDISDPDQVDRTIIEIGQLCGHIDVFVHGAGIDMSRSLRSKTIDQIRRVFNVKLKGAKNILDSLSKHDFLPRRIIGFGSVAGRFGNIAQIDYSAANDALAHLFRYLNLENSDVEASVIDWAPWSKIGMATRGSVQQTLEQAGIDFIDPENGVAAFMKELGRFEGSPEVLVAGKLGPFEKDAFETLESETGKTFLLSGQIATIESLTPGEHLRLSVKLDPSHPMLDDHRIDRAAILPGVGGIDLMRQATEILAPEARDLVIQDVHFPKALKIFKSDKFTAEIDVWRVSDPGLKFKAEISSRLLDKEGKPFGEKRIHHEMSFSTARPGNLDLPSDPKWNQTVFVAENDIYSVFFHGAAFRFLDYVSVEREGKGVRFRFRDTKNRPDMFKDLVPAAIEAAFQAGAAFGLESCGVMPLPISIERVAILKNNPIPVYGYVFPIELETKPEGEGRTKIKFDAILKESDGTPAIFVAGFEMIELARFGGFPNRIFEEISATNDLAENLNQDPELLKLFEPEDIEFTMANATEKRRREWISGRILLKRALARLVSSNGFRQKENRTIKIVTDSLGKPRAHFSDDSDSDFATLTLSHSNGLTMASAAASKSFWGIGVDIEMVEERSLSWASDYFSASEIELANFSGDFHRTLTQIWSLKEACLKALGIGLRCDLRDITVVSMDSAGRASLEFKNQPDEILREKRINLIDTRVEDMGDLVLSRVILRS